MGEKQVLVKVICGLDMLLWTNLKSNITFWSFSHQMQTAALVANQKDLVLNDILITAIMPI